MEAVGRFFLCGRCRTQVRICSDCDRGQIYCSGACSQLVRLASIREAGQRYQRSRRGRFAHAQRMRRYRARQEKVTHQGSPPPLPMLYWRWTRRQPQQQPLPFAHHRSSRHGTVIFVAVAVRRLCDPAFYVAALSRHTPANVWARPRPGDEDDHPTLLALASHYRYEPRPVAICRGNEKGRVERAIQFIRSAFFAARAFRDLADLNAQADAWCRGQASDRPCPEDGAMSVREAFLLEQPGLLNLPDNPFPCDEQVVVKAGKTPYVRFDLNDYSIPHTHVQRCLTVCASDDKVRVLDGAQVISCLDRSHDRDKQIEEPAHIAELVEKKRRARLHRGMDRLTQAAPASADLLAQAAKRGNNLGTITAALLRLLERYGAAELQAAILDALARDVPHPNAVRLALERRREEQHLPPPVVMLLPEHVIARDAPVQTHRLDSYDQLTAKDSDDEQTDQT